MNYPTETDNPKMADTYNGWSNYHTWNVSLYINNEYPLYKLACEWVEHQREFDAPVDYDIFRHTLAELHGDLTPDGVSWSDPTLDNDELSEMLQELV